MEFLSKIYYLLIPKTILGRFVLIICAPMIICQLVAVYIFYDRIWFSISAHNSKMLTNEVGLILDYYKIGDKTSLIKYSKLLNIKLEEAEGSPYIKKKKDRIELDILSSSFKENFDNFLGLEYYAKFGYINLYFYNNKNSYLVVQIPPKPAVNPISEIFILWILGISAFFMTVSLIFAKNQIRSIEELSEAANNFGDDLSRRPEFKPSGALEIKKAGMAFIKMHDRIRNQVKRRTQFLALISHDLRTPLTRMMLQMELLKESQEHILLKKDMQTMKQMLDSYLDFSRGEEFEQFAFIEMSKWIKEFFVQSRIQTIKLTHSKQKLYASIKPISFGRALTNIISNAQKYSKSQEFDYFERQGNIFMVVEDDGPGIPDAEKKNVFKAFYRSSKSRTLGQDGSVGLGLSIAKEIVLDHKGTIEIKDSKKLGGAKIIVSIPLVSKEKIND
ncbi:MAG: HAMP domain-containing sensor histidine kinase [Rickettsiaceae bacterium]|nr:HAMP domain-containing sensor histidine kinase [Rickettsiaceae bacterium]